MEPIGDILKRLAIRRNTPLDVMDISSNPEPACPRCGGTGWLRRDVPVVDPAFGEIIACDCKAREIQDRRIRTLVARSNLAAMANMTFDSFIGEARESSAFRQARSFAEHADGWLVIMGGYGTGKTHLAAAIGNYRLHMLGEPALFVVVPDLLDHLRAAYAPESETSHDEMFEGVRQSPLLILDDMGTQISTKWAQQKVFQLLNHRYVARLPTVITTNNSLDEFDGRLASRMSDPDISKLVSINVGDFRAGLAERGPAVPQTSRGGKRRGRVDIQYNDGL